MRREIVTHAQIVELTQEVIRGFYSRKVGQLADYLDDHFLWIGAFEFQFARSKAEFLHMIDSELNSIPFEMYDEHYELVTRDRDTFVLCCKVRLIGRLPDGGQVQTSTRLTVIWRYVEGDLKLIHIHGSNAQDVPLVVEKPEPGSDEIPEDFVDYLQNSGKVGGKLMFRTTSGQHRVIYEQDVDYFQAQGQTTLVHTRDEVLEISGILRSHQAKLSPNFIRIHKSFVVNLARVTGIVRYRMTLDNGKELPVSKERYLALKQRLLSYAGQR